MAEPRLKYQINRNTEYLSHPFLLQQPYRGCPVCVGPCDCASALKKVCTNDSNCQYQQINAACDTGNCQRCRNCIAANAYPLPDTTNTTGWWYGDASRTGSATYTASEAFAQSVPYLPPAVREAFYQGQVAVNPDGLVEELGCDKEADRLTLSCIRSNYNTALGGQSCSLQGSPISRYAAFWGSGHM